MSLLTSEPLAAAAGFALVLLAIVAFSRYWVTGVLLLVAVAYVAVPYTQGGNYVARILTEQVLLVLFLALRGMHIAWTGYVTRGRFKVVLAISIALPAWVWILRGAPSKLWVAIASIAAIVVWRIVINMGTSAAEAEDASRQQAASEVTADLLIKRDQALLEAIYKVTHGRVGKFVAAREIAPFLQLSVHDAEVAVHRLITSSKIEEMIGDTPLLDEELRRMSIRA